MSCVLVREQGQWVIVQSHASLPVQDAEIFTLETGYGDLHDGLRALRLSNDQGRAAQNVPICTPGLVITEDRRPRLTADPVPLPRRASTTFGSQ